MLSRRDFLQVSAAAATLMSGLQPLGRQAAAQAITQDSLLEFEALGNVTLLHITDIHAQLVPLYFREPSINLGVGELAGVPPHLTGMDFLERYNIKEKSPKAYALSSTDFTELARSYGRVGGCIITGNEDGIKHCAMNILYSLQHLGYTIPPQADAGWIGEAGPGPSYLDPGSGGPENEFTQRNTTFMTWNLLHFARMLKDRGGVPAHGNQRSAWDAGRRFDHPNPEHR
ncbi:MAG: twin-arginine translocation signal domain-containing protein [Limibacillus sp.]